MMDFYLFDVEHGQSAAVKLPNGRWCLFDAGRSATVSATGFINAEERKEKERQRIQQLATASLLGLRPPQQSGGGLAALAAALEPPFRYLKATISHLHGDHLADYEAMLRALPEFFHTVAWDDEYLEDVRDSSTEDSYNLICAFCNRFNTTYTGSGTPDYGVASIFEMSVAPKDARALGGTANSHVNNASIITRINCYGNSILICGDMENECWDLVLNRSRRKDQWRNLVSNVDVLVAPHHGHTSGYSTTLLELAKPHVVLVSVVTGDEHVDSRYSGEAVSGIILNGNTYKALTTRSDGTISFTINPPKAGELKGIRTWSNL